jgi:hypothetical protein
MQRPVAEDAGWCFEIADGPNSGATVMLAPGRYRLGSSADNDIVLADPAVAPEHAAMELAGDRASISVLAPGIQMQRRKLDQGRNYKLTSGAVITLGATRVRFAGPPGLSHRHKTGKLAMCVTALAVACGGAAYYFAAPTAVGAAQSEQSADGPSSTMTLARAAADLQAHLAATRAAPDVRVTVADGVVLATGTILPAEHSAWLDAQKWFDTHLGGRFALADHVGSPAAAELPKLDVAAVSMAPVPNVITRDGEHYTVGTVLQGGWYIARIAANAIILRSGTHEIRIDL